MHTALHAALAASLLTSVVLAQGVSGETQAPPSAPGQDPSTSSPAPSPLAGTAIVPQAFAATFGNTNNNIPFSWTPTRYQQPFLGSEMPPVLQIRALGLRHDQAFSGYQGQQIDVEIWLGFTTKSYTNLDTTFANNFDSGTPINVLPRTMFTLPNMASTLPTDPGLFQIQIPFATPFIWVQQANRNLLIEVIVHGNSNNNAIFTYPLDACSGTGATTSRLYGASSAATGTLGASYGLVMCFQDKVKTTATFTNFGAGCQGTGGKAGVVLPAAMKTAMGNSNNYFGVGYANQYYQQIFAGSEVGQPRRFTGHAYRPRANYGGGSVTVEIKMSSTKNAPGAMSATFANNITSTQTTVFNGNLNYPASVVNTDPSRFDIRVPWTTPWTWVAPSGEHLLIQIVNTSTANLSYFPDAISGNANVARCYGSPSTATTGTVGLNYGLVMCFEYVGQGSSIPQLKNNGRPIIAKSFSIDVADAAANTAAALLFGFSNTTWGAIPLPLNLGIFGAGSCNLLVSLDLAFATAVNAQGVGSVVFPLPNDVTLVNATWHSQYMVLDPGANSFGWAFSNGGTATVGEQ